MPIQEHQKFYQALQMALLNTNLLKQKGVKKIAVDDLDDFIDKMNQMGTNHLAGWIRILAYAIVERNHGK